MPNFEGCFIKLKFLPDVFQAVKCMYNIITWVCFSQLECMIHGMFVFKMDMCLVIKPDTTSGRQ